MSPVAADPVPFQVGWCDCDSCEFGNFGSCDECVAWYWGYDTSQALLREDAQCYSIIRQFDAREAAFCAPRFQAGLMCDVNPDGGPYDNNYYWERAIPDHLCDAVMPLHKQLYPTCYLPKQPGQTQAQRPVANTGNNPNYAKWAQNARAEITKLIERLRFAANDPSGFRLAKVMGKGMISRARNWVDKLPVGKGQRFDTQPAPDIKSSDPITASGAASIDEVFATVYGIPLEFVYRSDIDYDSPYGYGWKPIYHQEIVAAPVWESEASCFSEQDLIWYTKDFGQVRFQFQNKTQNANGEIWHFKAKAPNRQTLDAYRPDSGQWYKRLIVTDIDAASTLTFLPRKDLRSSAFELALVRSATGQAIEIEWALGRVQALKTNAAGTIQRLNFVYGQQQAWRPIKEVLRCITEAATCEAKAPLLEFGHASKRDVKDSKGHVLDVEIELTSISDRTLKGMFFSYAGRNDAAADIVENDTVFPMGNDEVDQICQSLCTHVDTPTTTSCHNQDLCEQSWLQLVGLYCPKANSQACADALRKEMDLPGCAQQCETECKKHPRGYGQPGDARHLLSQVKDFEGRILVTNVYNLDDNQQPSYAKVVDHYQGALDDAHKIHFSYFDLTSQPPNELEGLDAPKECVEDSDCSYQNPPYDTRFCNQNGRCERGCREEWECRPPFLGSDSQGNFLSCINNQCGLGVPHPLPPYHGPSGFEPMELCSPNDSKPIRHPASKRGIQDPEWAVAAQYPDALRTTYYSSSWQTLRAIGPEGTSEWNYDAAGRLIGRMTPIGAHTCLNLDPVYGDPIREVRYPARSFDNLDAPPQVMTYDYALPWRRLKEVRVVGGPVTEYVRDPLGRILAVGQAVSQITATDYSVNWTCLDYEDSHASDVAPMGEWAQFDPNLVQNMLLPSAPQPDPYGIVIQKDSVDFDAVATTNMGFDVYRTRAHLSSPLGVALPEGEFGEVVDGRHIYYFNVENGGLTFNGDASALFGASGRALLYAEAGRMRGHTLEQENGPSCGDAICEMGEQFCADCIAPTVAVPVFETAEHEFVFDGLQTQLLVRSAASTQILAEQREYGLFTVRSTWLHEAYWLGMTLNVMTPAGLDTLTVVESSSSDSTLLLRAASPAAWSSALNDGVTLLTRASDGGWTAVAPGADLHSDDFGTGGVANSGLHIGDTISYSSGGTPVLTGLTVGQVLTPPSGSSGNPGVLVTGLNFANAAGGGYSFSSSMAGLVTLLGPSGIGETRLLPDVSTGITQSLDFSLLGFRVDVSAISTFVSAAQLGDILNGTSFDISSPSVTGEASVVALSTDGASPGHYSFSAAGAGAVMLSGPSGSESVSVGVLMPGMNSDLNFATLHVSLTLRAGSGMANEALLGALSGRFINVASSAFSQIGPAIAGRAYDLTTETDRPNLIDGMAPPSWNGNHYVLLGRTGCAEHLQAFTNKPYGYYDTIPAHIISPDGAVTTQSGFTPFGATTVVLDSTGSDPIERQFTYDPLFGIKVSEAAANAGDHTVKPGSGLRTVLNLNGTTDHTERDNVNPGQPAVRSYFAYDAANNVREIDYSTKHQTFLLNGQYQVEVASEAGGNLGNIDPVVAVDGTPARATCTQYDLQGRVLERFLPEGNAVRYVYRPDGNVSEIWKGYEDPAVIAMLPESIRVGCQLPRMNHPAGMERVASYEYDRSDRGLLSKAIEGNRTTVFYYDGFGREISRAIVLATESMGGLMQVETAWRAEGTRYDAVGRVIERTLWSPDYRRAGPADFDDPELVSATFFSYDLLNRVTAQTRWCFTDNNGVRAACQDGRDHSTITTYEDDTHTVQTTEQPSGLIARVKYDGLGRPVLAKRAIGTANERTVSTVYTQGGEVRTVDASPTPALSGHTITVTELNPWGAVAKVKVEGIEVRSQTYDLLGRPNTSTTVGFGPHQLRYDDYGRVKAEWQEIGEFDSATTQYQRDANDRVVKIIDPMQKETTYDFDGLDRLWRTTNGIGITTTTFVPGTRLPATITRPGNLVETFHYRPISGELESIQVGGQMRKFQYDRASRIAQADVAQSFAQPCVDGFCPPPIVNIQNSVYRDYDSLGRLRSDRNSLLPVGIANTFGVQTDTVGVTSGQAVEATLTLNRDNAYRLSQVQFNGVPEVTFNYASGALSSIDYRNGVAQTFEYGIRGIPSGVDVARNATLLASQHDALGRPGIPYERLRKLGALAPTTDLYRYDHAGRVVAENLNLNDVALSNDSNPWLDVDGNWNANKPELIYSLDESGNWNSRTVTGGQALWSVQAPAMSIDSANRYTQIDFGNGFEAVSYDARGNLTQVNNLSLQFDHFDELRSTTRQTNGGAAFVSFEHDALGRRISETRDGNTTYLLWNGDSLVAWVPQNAPQQARYRLSVGENTLALIDPQHTYYIHNGSDGSALAASDANGNFVEGYRYTSRGDVTSIDANEDVLNGSSHIDNRFLFRGQLYDPASLTYAMGAREYLPGLGRFVSPDPLGQAGGANVYDYVGQQALTAYDPSGLFPKAFGRFNDGVREFSQGVARQTVKLGMGMLDLGYKALDGELFLELVGGTLRWGQNDVGDFVTTGNPEALLRTIQGVNKINPVDLLLEQAAQGVQSLAEGTAAGVGQGLVDLVAAAEGLKGVGEALQESGAAGTGYGGFKRPDIPEEFYEVNNLNEVDNLNQKKYLLDNGFVNGRAQMIDGRSSNCGNVAIAGDFALRGERAVAAPGSVTEVTDIESWYKDYTARSSDPGINRYASFWSATQAGIEEALTDINQENVTGIIYVGDAAYNYGHYFNFRFEGGQVRYYDFQNGEMGWVDNLGTRAGLPDGGWTDVRWMVTSFGRR